MKTFNDTIEFNASEITFNGYGYFSDSVQDNIAVSDKAKKAIARIFRDDIDVGESTDKQISVQRDAIDEISVADKATKSIADILIDYLTLSDRTQKSLSRTIQDLLRQTRLLKVIVSLFKILSQPQRQSQRRLVASL